MDSLSREMLNYPKNELTFIRAAVLGGENLNQLAPNRETPSPADALALLRSRTDLITKHGISEASLVELCKKKIPQLIDIALRNEDVTHYESLMYNESRELNSELSEGSLAECVYQSEKYLDLLSRLNLANCRECSNAIAGILSRDNPDLKVATVASMAHDHQFVLVGRQLPFRLDDISDLDPDTVVVDPWSGTVALALDAFLARDAFKNGYDLSSLRYTNIFYDPLS